MTAPCPALGFLVAMDVASEVGSDDWNATVDAWIEFLESRGLYCAGGGARRLEYTVASEAVQATCNDREAVQWWLSQRTDISGWQIGELEDLNQAV
jgi:uncharacterized protein YggL (DUF469 family)